MAGTAHNERFGAMAGVPRWKVFTNSKLRGSWQVLVARHCAKPPLRCTQAGDSVVERAVPRNESTARQRSGNLKM